LSGALHFEEYGEAGSPVLIFLHGLLGSSRNWRSVAKALSDKYKIYAVDLPEHGGSPHSVSTSLSAMQSQVSEWIESHISGNYVLCGHSLGGKIAMGYACSHPNNLRGIVVGDIAPRDYPSEHHIPTLDALLSLDLQRIDSRKEADEQLEAKVPNWAFRQFLLTNLEQEDGAWQWRANISGLRASICRLSSNPIQSSDSFTGPTLFVRGGKSGYLRSEHFPLVEKSFPSAKIVTLPEAGHDVHVEDKEGFLLHLREFLSGTF
jgi:esterase